MREDLKILSLIGDKELLKDWKNYLKKYPKTKENHLTNLVNGFNQFLTFQEIKSILKIKPLPKIEIRFNKYEIDGGKIVLKKKRD